MKTRQYTEIRTIRPENLHKLCVKNGWYTIGFSSEYGHLLFELAGSKKNLNAADMIEIAKDIIENSVLDDDALFSVAVEVARIADVIFV